MCRFLCLLKAWLQDCNLDGFDVGVDAACWILPDGESSKWLDNKLLWANIHELEPVRLVPLRKLWFLLKYHEESSIKKRQVPPDLLQTPRSFISNIHHFQNVFPKTEYKSI